MTSWKVLSTQRNHDVSFSHPFSQSSKFVRQSSPTMLAGRAASAVLRRSLARSAGAASSAGRVASVPVAATSALPPSSITSVSSASRSFSTAIEESLSARDAWQKSCYVEIDYSINEDLTVYDAIQRFAAYDIGCLVTVDSEGAFRRVVRELRRMKCSSGRSCSWRTDACGG